MTKEESQPKCKWTYDEYHGKHDTDCGNAYSFSDPEMDEGFVFCPYCGREIEEIREVEDAG